MNNELKELKIMGFAEVKTKADAIQKSVEESSILVGKTGAGSVSGVTVPVGLDGMEAYSKSLQMLSTSLKQSMFKILFMGTFKNGKSTTINALLGQELLIVGTTAATAVISQVSYGDKNGLVRIFKNGLATPEIISFEQYKKKYKLNIEDKKLIQETGSADRFKDIDYISLTDNSELLKNGVTMTDSPGLEESQSRTKATQQFFPQANAIIFLLDAIKLFTEKEKFFILTHFAKIEPKPRNIFFLVNRINQADGEEGRQEVFDSVNDTLSPLFTKGSIFNKDFYNKRVFFVNSLAVYKERKSGIPSDEIGVKDFKRFEKELEAFLTSDDRVIARYQPVAANLAAVYLEAVNQIRQRNLILSKTPAELERNQLESAKKLKELKKDIERMEETIANTQSIVATKIFADLQTFLTTDILAIWKKHSETFDKRLGILDMLKLASPFHTDKEKQEIFSPMTSFIQTFIEQQLIDWSDNCPLLIQEDMDKMREKLNTQGEEFSINLAIAHNIFVNGDSDTETAEWGKDGSPNKLQLLLSIIQGDISVAVENASGGNFTWGQFLKKYIFQAVINVIILILVGGGPLGLAALLAVESIGIKVAANERSVEVLNKLAEKIFPRVAQSMDASREKILASINEQFDKIKENITQAAYDLIEDERLVQAKILEDINKTKAENQAELSRQNTIASELRKRAAFVYRALYDEKPTDDDFKKLAATVFVSQKELT